MTFNYKHTLFSLSLLQKQARRIWKGHIYKGDIKEKKSFILKSPGLSSLFQVTR